MQFFSRLAPYLAGAIFLLSLLGLPFLGAQDGLFLSPDENAVAQFANVRASNWFGLVDQFERFDSLVHPRSVLSFEGELVPASFVGLPVIFGLIGSILGIWIQPFLTPLLAILGLLGIFFFIRKYFDSRFAVASTVLLAIHPAYWYYSMRGFMANVPMVVSLIGAAWLGSSSIVWRFFGVGLLVGLAGFLRTSELVWILPAVLGIFIINRKSIKGDQIVQFVIGLVLMLGLMAAVNYQAFGSPWLTGYTLSSANVETIEPVGSDAASTIESSGTQAWLSRAGDILLPFGFHERSILRNTWSYGVALYPWMTILAVVGFIAVIDRLRKRSIDSGSPAFAFWKTLIVIAPLISIWLFVLYGSWTLFDNPNRDLISIGNSYVRYWLPIFVLATPFAALGLSLIAQKLSLIARPEIRLTATRYLIVIILFICTVLSTHLVYFGHDGVVPSIAALESNRQKREVVTSLTEDQSIIIVDRADKYLWPKRAVIVPLRSESTYAVMPKIVSDGVVLYYFGITFPEKDLTWLNTVKLPPLGLQITLVETVGDETLYRIEKYDE